MTTGGGWQDQIGGVLPGVKLAVSPQGRSLEVFHKCDSFVCFYFYLFLNFFYRNKKISIFLFFSCNVSGATNNFAIRVSSCSDVQPTYSHRFYWW